MIDRYIFRPPFLLVHIISSMSNNKVKTVLFGLGILNKQHQGWDKLTEANINHETIIN